ncbi:MAG: GatB/YqeY domain-containing protein [Candidatus Cyclobacteriaceae bacterium M3_2C_046]
MSLKKQIEADMKQAMLQKNKEELTALRSIKSMILLAQSDKGAGQELSEQEEIQLLSKAAKQRRESAEIYQKEGRDDLAEKEKGELDIINRYLPQQLSQQELELALKNIINQIGASGPQDMGRVMGIASKTLAGKAEGKTIASTVKSLLSK